MHQRKIMAAALLSLASLGAQATTTASVSLTDFKVTLKDLAPNDGRNATIGWNNAWLQAYSNDQVQQGWELVYANQWGNSWGPRWTDHSQFISEWSQSAVTATSALGFGTQSVTTVDKVFSSMSASFSVEAGQQSHSYAGGQFDLTLGAHTEVTFSMIVTGSLSGAGYDGTWRPAEGNWYGQHAVAYYSGSMQANGSSSFHESRTNDWVGAPDSFESSTDGTLIKLSLRNTSAESRNYALILRGDIQIAELTTPVPEPSTYAMMALGLVGIGLTVRRRQRKD